MYFHGKVKSYYTRLIRPALKYASEIWALSIADEKALAIFEGKVLRSV
jgi:hypothetical protein